MSIDTMKKSLGFSAGVEALRGLLEGDSRTEILDRLDLSDKGLEEAIEGLEAVQNMWVYVMVEEVDNFPSFRYTVVEAESEDEAYDNGYNEIGKDSDTFMNDFVFQPNLGG